MEQSFFFSTLHYYCSALTLVVKCVVNVTKTLKQTKLHPGDSQLRVLLQPPPPSTTVSPSMLEVITKKTFRQAGSEETASKTSDS